ncbi:OST3 / OST6 family, transporter family protein [Giardia muris]|uniref:OST3 / OST6 family, transporter family protein n=1 Tax=Giardia muris TaxID=5742 RepID=A0A4Z1T4D5_GIAMU|nr:OST3 / OST6 family, transporter family protein [Giardia muris]|eukprot:TNJ28853.1 OST3 / OST6 family, transporter family protein [Giardia muris]
MKAIVRVADRIQANATMAAAWVSRVIQPVHFYIAICIAYMLSTSGIIFNVINQPPPYGEQQNADGTVTTTTLYRGMQMQYSSEGYMSGLINLIIGLSCVMLLREVRRKARPHYLGGELAVCIGAYVLQARRVRQKLGF